jgi:hypothetical protein
MEPQGYRFRGGRVFLEGTGVVFAGLIAPLVVREFALPSIPGPTGPVLVAVLLLALILTRWRSRIRLDMEGIERRSGNRLVTRLAWDEVDELFLLGRDGFEVRGAGKSVRLSSAYRIPWNARDLCSERLTGLRDRLRDRALRDGELAFRMPATRLRAHASYLVSVLFLTVVTGLLLAPLFRRGRLGFPVFIVFFGGSWLWGLRRRASRLGTVVTLYPDGLLVRRLDGRDKIAWSTLASTEWDGRGGLVLTLQSGRKIPLPPSLGNITVLEEFMEEGREAAAARR